ncbi:hypothetical protein CN096_28130 [Sinorhizobium meliloti]|nr:hypothetical protein CN089_34765 [Sinorhizobium meliloti]RVP98386.1 hypothetical protein CN096_28130 [Sinorhizobium meliloti]
METSFTQKSLNRRPSPNAYWADKDYRLDQVARRSTYEWLLIFSSSAFTSAKGKSADEAYASEG